MVRHTRPANEVDVRIATEPIRLALRAYSFTAIVAAVSVKHLPVIRFWVVFARGQLIISLVVPVVIGNDQSFYLDRVKIIEKLDLGKLTGFRGYEVVYPRKFQQPSRLSWK